MVRPLAQILAPTDCVLKGDAFLEVFFLLL